MNVNMLEHMAMLDSYIAIGMDSSLRERTNIVLGIQLVSFIIDEEDFHTRLPFKDTMKALFMKEVLVDHLRSTLVGKILICKGLNE
jgi:hypothetical protein